MGILTPVKEEIARMPHHLDPKEVMQRTKVLDGKLGIKTINEPSKKTVGVVRQDNAIDIEEKVGSGNTLAIDK